jgi:hypothetical protein
MSLGRFDERSLGPESTVAQDRIKYRMPLWLLSPLIVTTTTFVGDFSAAGLWESSP